MVCIFYRTKNQVRGLCVGGDMAILFFGDFARHGEYFQDSQKSIFLILIKPAKIEKPTKK